MSFFSKHVVIFLGGAVASLAAEGFAKSPSGHKLAVNLMAAGMKAKDQAVATYETIKEEANDIREEAKLKNNG